MSETPAITMSNIHGTDIKSLPRGIWAGAQLLIPTSNIQDESLIGYRDICRHFDSMGATDGYLRAALAPSYYQVLAIVILDPYTGQSCIVTSSTSTGTSSFLSTPFGQ
jgi:hypothetical protein